MLYTISLALPPEEAAGDANWKKKAIQKAGLQQSQITAIFLHKRSIDARSKNIIVNLTVHIYTEEIPERKNKISRKTGCPLVCRTTTCSARKYPASPAISIKNGARCGGSSTAKIPAGDKCLDITTINCSSVSIVSCLAKFFPLLADLRSPLKNGGFEIIQSYFFPRSK